MLIARRSRLLVAILLSLAAASLSACGDDSSGDLLSSERAAGLQETLDGVQQAANQGDCSTARSQAVELENRVQSLPRDTDSELQSALASGADRLQALIEDRCTPEEPEPTTTTPPATETTPEEDQQDKDKTDKEESGQEGKQDKPKKDEGQGNDPGTEQPEEETEPPVTEEESDETGGSGE
jgi:hypothetical protein